MTAQATLDAVQADLVQPEVDRRPTRERMLALVKLARELEAPGHTSRNGNG